MIKQIEEWESRNFRIAIFPQWDKGNWLWVAGIYIGNDTRAIWVDSANKLPRACYNTYQEAFNAISDYIDNYKPKKH